uniref:Chromo domain-containing protein n=1 Tax=Caenorhabditis tropicalis TaxID=1561998 RepID=A0A1I7T0Z5_9PELO
MTNSASEVNESNKREKVEEEVDDNEHDDDDDDDDDDNDNAEKWEVKEVTQMKYQNGRIEFLVTWESDGSITWEPISSFPGEYDHQMIQEYMKKNPQHCKQEMGKGETCASSRNYSNITVSKGSSRSTKKWTYELDSEDRYEKPDASAGREAKNLSDPNRLEDPEETVRKT